MELESKPGKDFKAQTKLETDTPQENHSLQTLQATQEGLQNDKETTKLPTIIPQNIHPRHKRPKQHKPDIIRAIGYGRNSQGHLVEDTTYKGRRSEYLIECKYSKDSNTLDTIINIHTIYEPPKQAILQHNKERLQVQIIPIGIRRTSNFHTSTLPEIAQLVSFNESPPDALTYKTLPTQAQTITMALHIHAQE
jgi:hypothetical protein